MKMETLSENSNQVMVIIVTISIVSSKCGDALITVSKLTALLTPVTMMLRMDNNQKLCRQTSKKIVRILSTKKKN